MRAADTYRAERRNGARFNGDLSGMTRMEGKVGQGRRVKWLSRHPKLSPYYTLAKGMLMSGPRAAVPTWRAIKKMMVVIATTPHIKHEVLGSVPAVLLQARYQRPGWRTYPHQTIDANLKVTGADLGKSTV